MQNTVAQDFDATLKQPFYLVLAWRPTRQFSKEGTMAFEAFKEEVRRVIEELIATGTMHGALELSAATGQRFNARPAAPVIKPILTRRYDDISPRQLFIERDMWGYFRGLAALRH